MLQCYYRIKIKNCFVANLWIVTSVCNSVVYVPRAILVFNYVTRNSICGHIFIHQVWADTLFGTYNVKQKSSTSLTFLEHESIFYVESLKSEPINMCLRLICITNKSRYKRRSIVSGSKTRHLSDGVWAIYSFLQCCQYCFLATWVNWTLIQMQISSLC